MNPVDMTRKRNRSLLCKIFYSTFNVLTNKVYSDFHFKLFYYSDLLLKIKIRTKADMNIAISFKMLILNLV